MKKERGHRSSPYITLSELDAIKFRGDSAVIVLLGDLPSTSGPQGYM